MFQLFGPIVSIPQPYCRTDGRAEFLSDNEKLPRLPERVRHVKLPPVIIFRPPPPQELAWRSSCVMDCHATTRGLITGEDGVKTELRVLRKGQYLGEPSLNDLAVDGTLNTTNQPFRPLNPIRRVMGCGLGVNALTRTISNF